MAAIDHVLLTRFNLPSPGAESRVRARTDWLRDRVELFERYCLPSVAAQRDADLRWIVYLDPASPSWLKERMDSLRRAGVLTPLYREGVPHADLVEDLAHVTGRSGTLLVTSNLDNDDGLSVDFAARVQAVAKAGQRTAIYLARGLVRSGGGLYRRRDPANAFCSVAEPWDEPLTCWADWHNRLGGIMPVTVVDGQPAWLQVVHGGNVSNRIQGVRVGPAAYRGLFTAGIADAHEPGTLEMIAEHAWRLPLRTAEAGLRTTARRAVVRLAGKEGLDKLKSILSARSAGT